MKMDELVPGKLYKAYETNPLNGAKVRVIKLRQRRNHSISSPPTLARVEVVDTIGHFGSPQPGEFYMVPPSALHSEWTEDHARMFVRFREAQARALETRAQLENSGVAGAELSADGQFVRVPVDEFFQLVAASEQAKALLTAEAHGDVRLCENCRPGLFGR